MDMTINRRALMQGTAAAGILAATGTTALAQSTPRRGGTLRVAFKGANTSDTWDGRTHTDSWMINMAHGGVFECLTQFNSSGDLVGEFADSWEGSNEARTWNFKLRRGARFHNGKAAGADDVIESLNLHAAEDSKSPVAGFVEAIETMEKVNENEVRITLKNSNADFPALMSDYHFLIYPAGMITEAIAQGIGTGPYRVESFNPGVRGVFRRVDDHHRADESGWFDEIEALGITDDVARTNALITGQVDVIDNVEKSTIPLLEAATNIAISSVSGNQHYTFPMLITADDRLQDPNIRRALKYACNRQEMVDKVLLGYGSVGNDTPIGPANQYVANDIDKVEYDPDRARDFLREAGLDSLDIDLSASDAAFNGAVDAALLYQNSAAAAGININVIQEPADGYWPNVWQKKPWCACYWGGRATEDWMFTQAYETGSNWNDTNWNNERFQQLLLMGRSELNPDNRRDIYREMQAIISSEGATVVAMFANYVDAYATDRVQNSGTIGNVWALDNSRVAKRWWAA